MAEACGSGERALVLADEGRVSQGYEDRTVMGIY